MPKQPKPTLECPNPPPLPPRTDKVLVWVPSTRKVIGGENEFKDEMKAHYHLVCDLTWKDCVVAAGENMQLHTLHTQYQQNKIRNILVLGAPMSGKRTHIPKLLTKYKLHHINAGALIANAASEYTNNGARIREFLNSRLQSLIEGKPVDAEPQDTRDIVDITEDIYNYINEHDANHHDFPLTSPSSSTSRSPTDLQLTSSKLTHVLTKYPSPALLSDDIVIPLVMAEIRSESAAQKGILLEGFPRTQKQVCLYV